MKIFAPENIKYLYDLACEIGPITIEPDIMLTLVINPDENNRGARVYVSYDGEPIARYPFTKQGVAQGLSRLRLAEKQSYVALREAIETLRGY